jgi:hypothetical protein
MTEPLDFPPSPTTGQKYTAPSGVVYEFDGYGWSIGFYDSSSQTFNTMGDIFDQIRTLLQDTDNSSSSGYRYSDDSIMMSLNMGLWEMYRIRPDIFLEKNFVVPQFDTGNLDAPWPVETQWVPIIVYYVVGMVQLRDDEPTQDQRASAFLGKFTSMLAAVA